MFQNPIYFFYVIGFSANYNVSYSVVGNSLILDKFSKNKSLAPTHLFRANKTSRK